MKLTEKGQTLLEVVMAIGVSGVVLGALLLVIFIGLRNATFSQNQTKATKLGAEAIDQIRSIRDGDGLVVNFEGDQCTDADSRSENTEFTFYDLWCNQLSSFPACSASTPNCYFKISTDASSNLSLIRADIISAKENLGDGLTRQIQISDKPSSFGTEKVLNVKVFWTDPSGEHQSNIETIMGRR